MKHFLVLLLASVLLVTSPACRTNETPEAQVKDVKIIANVKSKLAQDLQPATVTNISVNSTNGVVTLSGLAASDESKRRAEEIARNVEGVKSVNNDLQVQPPT